MSDDERAALVARGKSMASYTLTHQLADLLEADGKRIALAEDCIEAVRIHIEYGYAKGIPGDLRRYDAAREAGL